MATMNTKTLMVLGGGAALLWLAMDVGKSKADAGGSAASSTTVSGLAVQLANAVRTKGYDYPRPLCLSFQKAAGFAAKDQDGIYGPATASAVARYTTAPKALFKGAPAALTS